MASAAPSQTPQHSPSKRKPSAPPTSILPSQFAQIYSLAHPVLLLSLVVARFNAVVNGPIPELLNGIPFLVALQVIFVMVCLPPAGAKPETKDTAVAAPRTGTGTSPETRKSGPRRKIPKSSSNGFVGAFVHVLWKLTPALLSLTLTALLATPVLAILLVLFGAPFTTHQALTFLCGAHMALLAVFPLIYVHGVDGDVWREIWGASRPADAVWGGTLGTALGAWLGAVPIPLDWDRPWQAYPITVLAGAYGGYVLGVVLGRTKGVFGKRIEFADVPVLENEVKVD
ncbi:GPI biosynthesis protein family Pig-F-domain-containing protein [Aspergillus egyptiacus]|nr:GPI biosynthesis protein family Pig-F-domain-containing protein [Aspergillus egyptiacus]